MSNANDVSNEVLGEMTNVGEYYFDEQDGKYVSNNQRIQATANSYIKADLRNNIHYVFQNSFVFSGKLQESIAFPQF